MAGLTAKQKRFAEEYIVDLNATQAAIRAGYSEKTARAIGAENLTKPNIAEYIQQLMNERSERTRITADRVLEEYAKIGFADIKDYVSFRTGLTVVGHNDEGEPIIDTAHIVVAHDSEEVDGAPISEVSVSRDGTFKFKLHDKKGALDSIARHLGMFDDKLRLNVDGQVSHEYEYRIEQTISTDPETAELLKQLYKRNQVANTA